MLNQGHNWQCIMHFYWQFQDSTVFIKMPLNCWLLKQVSLSQYLKLWKWQPLLNLWIELSFNIGRVNLNFTTKNYNTFHKDNTFKLPAQPKHWNLFTDNFKILLLLHKCPWIAHHFHIFQYHNTWNCENNNNALLSKMVIFYLKLLTFQYHKWVKFSFTLE